MAKMIQKSQKIVIPSVDLGGTKIGFAFMTADEERKVARNYPPMEVVKSKGKIDARETLKRVAQLIRKRTREVEEMGWIVLRLVGIGAPGLHLDDGSVDPRTVPNIPGLARMKPPDALKKMLGKGWKVYVNNDGVVQAVAAAHAFVRSPDYTRKWSQAVEESGGKVIYFGPGTGFGAGKVRVREDNRINSVPGSQAFFDIVIRDGKTAEDLIGGRGIGKTAQERERANIEKGKAVLVKYTHGYKEGRKDPGKQGEAHLAEVSGKVLAEAYSSRDKGAKTIAKEIFVQAGRDLAKLMIQLHEGTGSKSILEWSEGDWNSVKGTRVFLAAGLLIKPTGKEVILPAARRTLKKEGYSGKIHIVEMDGLPTMAEIQGNIGVYGASLIVPEMEILGKKWSSFLRVGENAINAYMSDLVTKTSLKSGRPVVVAMDGYSGIDWEKIISRMKRRLKKKGLIVAMIDFRSFYRPPQEIEEIIRPCMSGDRTFGRIFGGKLDDLLNESRVSRLKERIENERKTETKSPRAILCFGPGAACKRLRKLYDIIIYRDISREEITRRRRTGLVVPLGAGGKGGSVKGQPAYLAGKRFHYIDFPVLDKHKRSLYRHVHLYIDDNLAAKPKLIGQEILGEMISHLARKPLQLKAFHDEGVWGGQWLKKVRNLPAEMINCAWAYELMAYQMSMEIPVGDTYLEVPFANILDKEPNKIMGEQVSRAFKGMWPIRVNYDDCWKGGDMAIQIHPDSSYIRKRFKEPLHQDESYYIMAAEPDAYVYLGLRDGMDMGEFHEAVRKAEAEGVPFDHREYVNVFPAKKGDLFLIPAGTVHASGKGCVVLELSSTTDRYTFHFYDYLRPDLNGELRDIHSEHAFDMVHKYPQRTTAWVKEMLIQEPRLIRKGKDWAEYLLGQLVELVFEVRRFEFVTTVEDDTQGYPHVLSMAEGNGVTIRPQAFPERRFDLNFSETVIVPACIGKYSITNRGDTPCRVLKTLVNTSPGRR
ncbi:hypothetical protein ACFL0Q_03440 [Thermodesulfobacteriota bacterium]